MRNSSKIKFTIDFKHVPQALETVKSALADFNGNIANERECEVDSDSSTMIPMDLIDSNINSIGTCSIESRKWRMTLEHGVIKNNCDKCILAIYGNLEEGYDLIGKLCTNDHEHICNVLSSDTVSSSFIYISLHTKFVYIGKDTFGFKSLLLSVSSNSLSVSDRSLNVTDQWFELPPFKVMIIGEEINFTNRNYSLSKRLNVNLINTREFKFNIILDVIHKVKCALINGVVEVCNKIMHERVITIFFSGGLDSALITTIVAKYVSNVVVELVNVSFDPLAPDRITALITFEELLNLFPNVDLRLILIDVDLNQYKGDEDFIYSLSLPNNTHMDMNISSSLYYASKLRGYLCLGEIFEKDTWKRFKCDLNVLKSINFKVTTFKEPKDGFVRTGMKKVADHIIDLPELEGYKNLDQGLFEEPIYIPCISYGADELFGGYGRHASAKIYNENERFVDEINKDLERLWKRNFGRDDRVLNSNGVTALYPYLSSVVIDALAKLPFNPACIIDLLDPPEWFKDMKLYSSIRTNNLRNSEFLFSSKPTSIYINKWILREISLDFGLTHCCSFKKRAIQFGTRCAKTFNRIHNLSNRQASNKGSRVFK